MQNVLVFVWVYFCVVHVGGEVSDGVTLGVTFQGCLWHCLSRLLGWWAITFKNLKEARKAIRKNIYVYIIAIYL